MVWILDTGGDKPELSRLYVNSGHNNFHRAKNLARAQFFADTLTTLDLPGSAAKARMAGHTPLIFVRKSVDQQEEEDSQSAGNGSVVQSHFVLLRAHIAGSSRAVFGFSSHVIAGKPTLQEDEVEVSAEGVLDGRWWKITPKLALPNGEYAIVEVKDDKSDISSDVYDFGIGPAPAKKP